MISLMIRMMVFGAPLPAIPVDDPDTHSDRHKNDQCEVRSSQRNYIESAETGSDQHGNGKKDSDCFHKNAPSGYKITENLS